MTTDPHRPNGLSPENRGPVPEAVRRVLERKELFLKFGYDLDLEREAVLEAAAPLSGRILEAGTGKGHFAAVLAKRGIPFVSVDISREDQEIAALYLKYLGLEGFADFRTQNGEKTDFADRSFDMIFSINALHHFETPAKVLHEMDRVLAPGGMLVLSDFTKKGFETMDRIHALDGNCHGRGVMETTEAASHLERAGYRIKKSASTAMQETVVAEKPL